MLSRKVLIGVVAGFAMAGGATVAVIQAASQQPAPSIDKPVSHTFEEVDAFKATLAGALIKSPAEFSVSKAALELGSFRVDGEFAVCVSNIEVEAKQYVTLMKYLDVLTPKFPTVAAEVNHLLDSDIGLTDCQFRVLEALSRNVSTQ